MKYKNYSICKHYKTVYHKNKISGHIWSEQIELKSFRIIGLGVFSNRLFRSIKNCKEYIDYLIRNGLNRSYYDVRS